MNSQNGAEKEKELLEQARCEFLSSDSISLKALSEKYELKYWKIREAAKRENWRDKKDNQKDEKDDQNGGFNVSPNGGTPLSPDEDVIEEEITALRKMASGLAMNAGKALEAKEDWSVKDFDQLVGTWTKIIGTQAKLNGGADGIERLITDLTEGDEYPDG